TTRCKPPASPSTSTCRRCGATSTRSRTTWPSCRRRAKRPEAARILAPGHTRGRAMAQRLGIDSYSLRSQGWDAFQFLEYSAKVGLDNVHFSERRNFASLDSDYLRQLRARADELGLAVEVGMGSFDRLAESFRAEFGSGEQQLGDFVDAAVICGSPVVRC